MRVLEDICVDSYGMIFAKMHGYLNFAMDDVAFLDVASEETNDDYGRERDGLANDCMIGGTGRACEGFDGWLLGERGYAVRRENYGCEQYDATIRCGPLVRVCGLATDEGHCENGTPATWETSIV